MRSLTPITIIASDLCEDTGDSVEFFHLRWQKKLLDAFREINLFILPETKIKTEIFPADSTIELPCDFIYETKVGILKNNCLVTLDIDKNLRLNKTKATDTQMECDISGFMDGSIVPSEYYTFYNSFRSGMYLGELYGMGSGYHANTWYNIKDGVLELSSLFDPEAEIVIEYKSNGLADGFCLVPDEIVSALKMKAKELFYEDSKPTLAASFKEKYREERFRLKALYNYRTPDYYAFLFKSHDRAMHL